MYCPRCGKVNDGDLYCDNCGCDFRANPCIATPPIKRPEFRCSVCNKNQVSNPEEICADCKMEKSKQVILCPECKKTPVIKFGDICLKCIQKKPIKGTGTCFHIVK